MEKIVIREERPEDYRTVEELTRDAFWNVNAPGCDEHYLVHILRGHPDYLPELSLVLEADGVLAGSIQYTRAILTDETGRVKPVLTFGPLSVRPEFQRRGYGKRLQRASFDRALALGYDAVVIYGNPENYVSTGFRNGKRVGVSLGDGVYPTALLVRELREGALDGHHWIYRESAVYNVDPVAAAEYDRQFPRREPGYAPSQELFYIYSRSQVVR